MADDMIAVALVVTFSCILFKSVINDGCNGIQKGLINAGITFRIKILNIFRGKISKKSVYNFLKDRNTILHNESRTAIHTEYS